MKNWYIESAEDTVSAFSSDAERGLCSEQAQRALSSYGKNKLKEKEKKTIAQRFAAQFKNIMVVVLIIAAFIALVVEVVEAHGKPVNFAEPLIIFAIVILNAVLGVVQEVKAEASLDALYKMNTPLSKVRRDGEIKIIPSENIVPGDIVMLDAGDIIPADGRLLVCAGLKCDESSLTGESIPSEKNAAAKIDVTCPLSDRVNMVFSGCSVFCGHAEYVVTATGMRTEIGSIAGMLANKDEEQSPLQKRLAQLGKTLGLASLILCGVIFIIGALITKDWLNTFLVSSALAIAFIPERLLSTASLISACGVKRIYKLNTIVKNTSVVEAFGDASVICTDKTGVLTLDQMHLTRIWSYEDNALRNAYDLDPTADKSCVNLIQLAALCSDAKVTNNKNGINSESGDPTDLAFVRTLMNLGQEKCELESAYKRIFELPFDSERKLMTTVHSTASGIISITKGSPEAVLKKCTNTDVVRITSVFESMARDGLRVIAIACKKLLKTKTSFGSELEDSLTFIGLAGISDSHRDDSATAVAACRSCGIRTVMITGDNAFTAAAEARKLGILSDGEEVITGPELAKINDADLCTSVRKYSVYAAVSPYDKIRIIKAWQNAGEQIVITGSTVSDVPSLISADVGCAMAVSGTDVAKKAADAVVYDNSFSSLVSVIKEGHRTLYNIRKSLQYLISCALSEVISVFGCILIFNAPPLAAMHLLLINLIANSLPVIALGLEPSSSEFIRQKERGVSVNVLNNNEIIKTGIYGFIIGLLSIISFSVGYTLSGKDISAASTMAFGTLFLSHLAYVMTLRTDGTVFSPNIKSNKVMLYAQAISVIFFLLTMLVPPFMNIISFVSLSGTMWIWMIALALAIIFISEAVKLGERLYDKHTG